MTGVKEKEAHPLALSPARIFAVFAAVYPGMVDRFLSGDLTDAQVEMLIQEWGYIRHMDQQSTLRYAFSKFSDEDCEKMVGRQRVRDAPNLARDMAWELFAYAPYGLLDGAEGSVPASQPIPGMARETAEALCAWWTRGDCPDWAWLQVLPWTPRIIATADG